MTRRNKDWQVGPNLKPETGSQGTLFRGNGPMGERKWPRGYSPERLNAVKEKIGGPHLLKGDSGTNPSRRRLVDTVARSTVPVEHLNGVQFFPGQTALGGSPDPRESISGEYKRWGSGTREQTARRRVAGTPNPQIFLSKGNEATETPIHEIGHHRSAEIQTNHSSYNTEYKRGLEEGFADNYSHEHFRDKKRRPGRLSVYSGSHESMYNPAAGRGAHFLDGYYHARPEVNKSAVREEDAKNPETFEHLLRQGWQQLPLMEKRINTGRKNDLVEAAWRRMDRLPRVVE